jgi:hypothetical protein
MAPKKAKPPRYPRHAQIPSEVAVAVASNRPQFIAALRLQIELGKRTLTPSEIDGILGTLHEMVKWREQDQAHIRQLEDALRRIGDDRKKMVDSAGDMYRLLVDMSHAIGNALRKPEEGK